MEPKAGLDIWQREIFCPCRETNSGHQAPLSVQFTEWTTPVYANQSSMSSLIIKSVSQPANSSLLRIITTITTCSHVSEILNFCHPHARDRMCSGLQRPDSGHCSLERLLLTLRPCPCLGWRHNSTRMVQRSALYVNDKTKSRLDSFWGNSARS